MKLLRSRLLFRPLAFALAISVVSIIQPSANAQTISFLRVDEPTQTLSVHGNGFTSNPGGVTVGGYNIYVIRWSDTIILCSIPDTGISSAGPVKVFTLTDSSQPHLLSLLRFKASYTDSEDYYAKEVGSVSIHDRWDWYARLRFDLGGSRVSMPCGAVAARTSVALASFDEHHFQGNYRDDFLTGSDIEGWTPTRDTQSRSFFISATLLSPSYVRIDTLSIYHATANDRDAQNKKYYNVSRDIFFINASLRYTSLLLDSSSHFHKEDFDLSSTEGKQILHVQDDGSAFLPTQKSVQQVERLPLTTRTVSYPNPATSHVTILFQPILLSRTLVLIDQLGRKVYSALILPQQRSYDLNLANLPVGVYTIQIGGEIIRLIKSKG